MTRSTKCSLIFWENAAQQQEFQDLLSQVKHRVSSGGQLTMSSADGMVLLFLLKKYLAVETVAGHKDVTSGESVKLYPLRNVSRRAVRVGEGMKWPQIKLQRCDQFAGVSPSTTISSSSPMTNTDGGSGGSKVAIKKDEHDVIDTGMEIKSVIIAPSPKRFKPAKHFECSECNFQACYLETFRRHLFVWHHIISPGTHLYTCTKCPYQTVSCPAFRKHNRRAHPDTASGEQTVICSDASLVGPDTEAVLKPKRKSRKKKVTDKEQGGKLEKQVDKPALSTDMETSALADVSETKVKGVAKVTPSGTNILSVPKKQSPSKTRPPIVTKVGNNKGDELATTMAKCTHCELVFLSERELKSHAGAQHGAGGHSADKICCSVCEYKDALKIRVESHEFLEHGIPPQEDFLYSCLESSCTFGTLRRAELVQHVLVEHAKETEDREKLLMKLAAARRCRKRSHFHEHQSMTASVNQVSSPLGIELLRSLGSAPAVPGIPAQK